MSFSMDSNTLRILLAWVWNPIGILCEASSVSSGSEWVDEVVQL